MSTTYKVKQGDTLLSIAADHGFRDWHRIWDDAGNASLREERPNPQVLYAGDVITIPELLGPPRACATDQTHPSQPNTAQACFAHPLPGSQHYDNYREIHVPGRLAGQTMIDFLDAWHPQTGREQWLSWLADGLLTAEEVAVTADRIVREGERFVQHLPNTTEPDVNSSIKLLHEDEFLVVVDKPAPLPVHPSGRFNRNTLLYIVGQAYYPEKLRAAHRLDANTTGVLVLCRKYAGSRYVQPQFAQQTVNKVYVARVHGHPAWASKVCDSAISAAPEVHGSRNVDADGQAAITELRVLERFADGTSLLEVQPRTGRTNQIRVHLWDLGHPIMGDGLYMPDRQLGAGQTLATDAAPMCLHAWKMTIRHPQDKQWVTYEAPLPNWARQTVLP